MRAFCRHANQNVSRRHADQSLPCRRQALEITKAHGLKVFLEMHGGTIHPSASLAYRIVSNFEPQDIGVICEPTHDAPFRTCAALSPFPHRDSSQPIF